jgi:hypothetical protein
VDARSQAEALRDRGPDRRSGFDRRLINEMEADCIHACRLAGAIFVGIQTGFADHPSLCLFQQDRQSTTLALAVHQVTPLRIIERLHVAAVRQRTFRAGYGMRFTQPEKLSLLTTAR